MRNVLSRVSRANQSVVRAALQQVFVQTDEKSAHATWREVAGQLEKSAPTVTEMMDEAEADVLAYFAFPKAHRVKIHSTNTLERLNKEVKRRADVVGICPNEESINAAAGGGADVAERGMDAAEPLPATTQHSVDRPDR